MSSRVWACMLLVVGVVLGATVPPVTKYAVGSNGNGNHAYDIFWINTTAGFMITNNFGTHELYRTVDEGFTWTLQSLDNGCNVVRIYQDTEPQKLILMGPPELNCGWNTDNAGQTYNLISIPQLQYISFNPEMTNWALGRTADSRVYYTRNLGSTWELIPNVTRATWVLLADTTPSNGLHMLCMYMIKSGVFGYSFDQGDTFEALFPNMVELHTTSNFVYAVDQNRALLVGSNYKQIQSAYFPFGNLAPTVFTVSDDISGATWFFTDASFYWGNVYTTGSSGALYVQSLLHVLKREDAFLDFHSVQGLPGVHLANVVVNFNDYHDLLLKTYITFDNGGSWNPLASPGPACPTCSLNLYFNYKSGQRPYYTSSDTIGVVIANGYTGTAVSYEHPVGLKPYISRNAGLSWEAINVPAGPYLFEVGSNGGILVMAPENVLTNTIYYSFDEGLTFSSFTLVDTVYITRIFTPIGGGSLKFGIFALDSSGTNTGIVYGVDFSSFTVRQCGTADYENWAPSDGVSTITNCWLGQTVTYSRRIRSAQCTDTRGEQLVSSQSCQCGIEDYECDFGYVSTGSSKCYVASTLPPSPPSVCTSTYEKSQGYRLVPGDKCVGGLDLKPQILTCPKPTPSSSGSRKWVAVVVVLVIAAVVALIAFVIYRDPALRAKIAGLFGMSRDARYGRVGRAGSNSLAHEEDFGIQDDLLADEDAKVLHDNDITKEASNKS